MAEGSRKEAFEYLRKLGVVKYSSWEDIYFVEINGIFYVLELE